MPDTAPRFTDIEQFDYDESKHPRGEKGRWATVPLSQEERATAHARLAGLEKHVHPWKEAGEKPHRTDSIVKPEDVGFQRGTTERPAVIHGIQHDGKAWYENRSVPVKDIVATQPFVPEGGIRSYIDKLSGERTAEEDDPKLEMGAWHIPELSKDEGDDRYHVSGGHTRISAQMLAGRTEIRARVYFFAQRENSRGRKEWAQVRAPSAKPLKERVAKPLTLFPRQPNERYAAQEAFYSEDEARDDAGRWTHGGTGEEHAIPSLRDETRTLSPEAHGWLRTYQWGELPGVKAGDILSPLPSDKAIRDLTPFAGKGDRVLYRMEVIGEEHEHTGQQVTSWSRYSDDAMSLAYPDDPEHLAAAGVRPMQVISEVVPASAIIVDTTRLPKSYLDAHSAGTQHEVIVAHGALAERVARIRGQKVREPHGHYVFQPPGPAWYKGSASPPAGRWQRFGIERFDALPALSVSLSDYGDDLAAVFESAYREAGANVADLRGTQLALDNAKSHAESYARARGGDLITDIDKTTHERVQRIIGNAMRDGLSDKDVSDKLESLFGSVRADTIARSEVATAENRGVIQALKDAGENYVFATDEDECGQEICDLGDGEIWTIEEAEAEPLCHPNGSRSYRPLTGEELAEVLAEEGDAGEEGVGGFAALVLDRLARLEGLIERKFGGEFDEEKHPRDDRGRWTDGSGDETHATAVPAAPFKRMSELTEEQARIRREQNAARSKAFIERQKAKREAEKLKPPPEPKPPEPPKPPPPEPPPLAKPEPPPEGPPPGSNALDLHRDGQWTDLIASTNGGESLTHSSGGTISTYDRSGLPVFIGRAEPGVMTHFEEPRYDGKGNPIEPREFVLRVALDDRGFPISLPLMGAAGESPLYQRYREFSERLRNVATIRSSQERDRLARQTPEYKAARAAARERWEREKAARVPSTPKVPLTGPNRDKQEQVVRLLAAVQAAGMPASHLDGLRKIETKDAGMMHLKGYENQRAGGYHSSVTHSIVLAEHLPYAVPWGLVHEIGHHVHLTKLDNAAAREWANISREGSTAKLSSYAKENTGEHFAEAYKAYFGGHDVLSGSAERGSIGYAHSRENLRRSEPAAHAFMEKLARGEGLLAVGRKSNDHNRYTQKPGGKARSRKWA